MKLFLPQGGVIENGSRFGNGGWNIHSKDAGEGGVGGEEPGSSSWVNWQSSPLMTSSNNPMVWLFTYTLARTFSKYKHFKISFLNLVSLFFCPGLYLSLLRDRLGRLWLPLLISPSIFRSKSQIFLISFGKYVSV